MLRKAMMKEIIKVIIHEIVWLLIGAATFGLWALLAGIKDIFIIGMLVYIGVRVGAWIGKIEVYESIRKNQYQHEEAGATGKQSAKDNH